MFGKKEKIEANDTNIFKMLLPSLMGIAVCILCLLGTTYAWFAASIASSGINIQAADYEIVVEIKDHENNLVGPNSNGQFILSTRTSGNGYTVTILAKGTASTGYCLINDKMATKQLKPGESVQFTLYPEEDNELYTFVSYWGTYAGGFAIAENMTIGNPVNSAEESVEKQTLEISENEEESDLERESAETEENIIDDEIDAPVLSESDAQQIEDNISTGDTEPVETLQNDIDSTVSSGNIDLQTVETE